MDDWKKVLVSLSELVKQLALQQAVLMSDLAALRATVSEHPEMRAAYEAASAKEAKRSEETIDALTELCDSIVGQLKQSSSWKN